MIEYITGDIGELEPTMAVLECSGVGYGINITLMDYTKLQPLKRAKLYVHENIREDAHDLYGFITKQSRELFRQLIGVSGVGPNTARLILSSMTEDQLIDSIVNDKPGALKSVKGIGGKTAQRIIVDLKDKIKSTDISLISSTPEVGEAFDDAVAALTMLGFSTQASRMALKKLFSEDPSLTTEKAIKLALTML
ncbi:MAG: Holliday junction branch migration protein RuvA [Muribaculaceae bacterium]|nr:Holliday junction branch migration protein RuvA [Muribaculaceae bacterium]MDE7096085.1 Holliday junction branch migration protein RuvA [Muribaculaceae bacterium]